MSDQVFVVLDLIDPNPNQPILPNHLWLAWMKSH